jgi:hypothetical protein
MKTIIIFLFTFLTTVFGQTDTLNKKDSLSIVRQPTTINQASHIKAKQNSDNKASSNVTSWLIISGLLGIFGSSLTWLYNEWQKRINKLRSEKEERYKKLISLIRSFGIGAYDEKKANEFIIEFQLCWMYCPDIIITKGNNFIESLRNDTNPKEQVDKDLAKGELILEIRKDLMLTNKTFKFFYNKKNLTKLKAIDFKDVYFGNKNGSSMTIDKIV